MFFNLENYFAPVVDSAHPKREFSPAGIRHWTWDRFKIKTNGIYKTIVSIGGLEPPDIIGFCEIENRFVLNQLYYNTPLAKFDYGIVHQESPDRRGIDVALFYKKSTFVLVNKKFIRVDLGKRRTTRDILYAKGIVNELDTLHIMVVHAPSKYGGAAASEPNRQKFAAVLRHFIDSLNSVTNKLYLAIMGDFNDLPDSPSVAKVLQASANLQGYAPDTLYNLAMPLHKQGKGSLKYGGRWQLIDLAFVSGNLLNPREPLYCVPSDYRIFDAPFLLEEDAQGAGVIPKRTYRGMRYNGGISDHLPIVLDIRKNF
jgi:exonuclease III